MRGLILYTFTCIQFTVCTFINTKSYESWMQHKICIQDSIAYIHQVVDFIKQVNKTALDSNFVLTDKPSDLVMYSCLSNLLMDSLTFSTDELAFIRAKKYPSVTHWTKEIFSSVRIVNSDTVNAIFKDRTKGWNYFHKKIGRSFNGLSFPIFLRNYTYCIFYTDSHCDWLCGRGSLVLYKKVNDKWEPIKTYCNWIS